MGGKVVPSAQEHIAGENNGSRQERARLSLVVPIGVLVAVAIVCVIGAVLGSARWANEVSFNHDQQLVHQAIADQGRRVLRQVGSIAGTPRAAAMIRAGYDPEWVERRVGNWLQTFFETDAVVIVDGTDRIEYTRWRDSAAPNTAELQADLTPCLNLLRG